MLAQGPPPAWQTQPPLTYDEESARSYPLGNLNCGLVHGIPGPLAITALSSARGVEVGCCRRCAGASQPRSAVMRW